MRKKNLTVHKTAVGFLFFIFLLSGCKKEFNPDSWSPDILAPIIKSRASAKEVCDLKNKKFTQNIYVGDLGFDANTPLDLPALNFSSPVGPFVVELSDFFSFVEVDSAYLDISLVNSFPIAISAGTEVVFRTSASVADESNVIFRHAIQSDIAPAETYLFSSVLKTKKVTSDVYLFLEKFKSPGGNNITFTSNPAELSFEFKFLKVFAVALRTNREHTQVDTTEVAFFDDISDYDDNTAVGTLRVFLTNAMPINFGFQMYFLDETKQTVIDSIYYHDGFSEHRDIYSPGGITMAPTGEPIDSTTVKFEFPITASRIRKLKQAKFLVFRLSGDTNGYTGEEVYVGGNSNLQVLITGDLKIRIASLF